MSIVYQAGLHGLMPERAPFYNCNAVEDLGNAIQRFYESSSFSAREVFPADAEVLEGGMDSPFAYVWRGEDVSGIDYGAPEGLLELAPKLLADFGSLPSGFDLPGIGCDILVPNVARASGSARADLLDSTRVLDRASFFLGRPVNVGSLTAMIDALEDDRRAASGDDERTSMLDALLASMRVAQRYELFFTLRF